ncbi:mechanosensitive ion channel family protein [Halomonas shantousis]
MAWAYGPVLVNFALVLGIAIVSYLVLRAVMSIVINRTVHWLSRTPGRWGHYAAEIFKHTKRWLIAVMALQIGLLVVDLGPGWDARISHLWFLVLAVQFGLWADAAITLWKAESIHGGFGLDNQLTVTMIALMLRVVLWAVVVLSVLANLGVNITAFIASLGIGGIAIALAVQAVLGDLFASMSIGVDKPFRTGDFIVFGDIAGTVEYIGLKTTRIRSLSGEQVICSNTQLLQQTIHNYKRMQERRVVFSFAISYRTPGHKVREIPPLLKRIVTSLDDTRFDRAHLLALDEHALKFEVVYYVLSADYNLYMDVQQAINLALLDALDERDIKFAMPVRSLEFLDDIPLARGEGTISAGEPSGEASSLPGAS